MDGITRIENFIKEPQALFEELWDHIVWDEHMKPRKTASFGVAYNYSQIHYPFQAFPRAISELLGPISEVLKLTPNNCLINYYPNGHSTMGFHSDQIDILEDQTGVAILSLGSTRILRFRKIACREQRVDYTLHAGSLLYMSQQVQSIWQHAIPTSDTGEARMSLTFRSITA